MNPIQRRLLRKHLRALREARELAQLELELHRHRDPTLRDVMERLNQIEHKIMSAISDFAAKVNAFNDRIDAAITNLQGDVKNLEDQIAALQASPGAVTPEDQKSLDDIQARASSIADKLDALDALTPQFGPLAA